MRFLFNLIWLLLAGWWLAVGWVLVSIALTLTIIGIPFAVQAIKIASFVLWPFGRTVVERPDNDLRTLGAVGNVIWIVLAGWWLALLHLVTGVLLFITIVGIPLALADFKMIPITFAPFGREIVPEHDAGGGSEAVLAMPSSWGDRHAHAA